MALPTSSQQVLLNNVMATPDALAGTQGAGADELYEDNVTLVSLVLDESGSMDNCRQDVIDGYNQMLEAMRGSSERDAILLSTWLFNHQPRLLHDYQVLEQVAALNTADYELNYTTALYSTVLDALSGMMVYRQRLQDQGIRTREVLVVLTDGADNESSKSDLADLRQLAADVQQLETVTLVVAGFRGNDPHAASGFAQDIANDMGFPHAFGAVIEVTGTPQEIRRVFNMVSDSVQRISSGKINSGGNSFFTP